MSKSEIVLELVKLSFTSYLSEAKSKGNFDTSKAVVDLYNTIYDGIKETESCE